MDGEPVCGRKIDSFELDIGVHEPGDKRDASGQPVQFGNDKGGPMEAAGGKCFREPWAICTTPRLDLGVFGDQFAGTAYAVSDSLSLSV
jgi:hypothetical protein